MGTAPRRPTRTPWREWLRELFPAYVRAGFAPRHEELWAWADAVRLRQPSAPFVACWGRGGAKSTSAELCVVRWGATQARRYGLYVCETQEQADDHAGNIAALLETPALAQQHPQLADRLVGKFGQSKGWRRNRVRCASGFTVDALGLDTAARGVKLEDMRPDFLIIDDIDGTEDTEATAAKKARTLTRKLLPALTHDAAILFIQNKVHDDSLMAQRLDGRAEFLGGAILSGPHCAIDGLETVGSGTEARIVAGVATWQGQSVEDCQRFIARWGLEAFEAECQHASVAQAGRYLASIGLWDACADATLPPLGPHEPAILAVDAGESSDTFAWCVLTRHPRDPRRIALRRSRVYVPDGEPLDFDAIERDLIAECATYAIVELAYDRFLLGQTMRRLATRVRCPLVPFNQNGDRLEADKATRDAILARTLPHDGTHSDVRQHLDNANAKSSSDGRQVRIVKRQQSKKIDAAVALSMGHARAATLPYALPQAAVGGTRPQMKVH